MTDPVAANIEDLGKYAGHMLVLKNGCDAEHWISATDGRAHAPTRASVIYQGGINGRLDYSLIEKIVAEMPDWRFWFCGNAANAAQPQWNNICAQAECARVWTDHTRT